MSLKSLFRDIANAIREQDGTTADIVASTFPERIRSIPTGVDTSDATAVAGNILVGKTAYAKGVKIIGTIPSQSAHTIVPGTVNKTIAAGTYLSGTLTVRGDSNLKASNIVQGVKIFGITGTFDMSKVPRLTIDVEWEGTPCDADAVCPDGTVIIPVRTEEDGSYFTFTFIAHQYGKYTIRCDSDTGVYSGDVTFVSGGPTNKSIFLTEWGR